MAPGRLGTAIRRRREGLGLSQLAFARRAGVSQPALWQVESGERENPGIEFVRRVARALRVTVADLTGEPAMADMQGQGDREKGIFRRFAEAARLGVRPDSIQKRKPPEPDIACETADGPVAFEMIELVDREIAREHGAQFAIERLLAEIMERQGVSGLGDAAVYVAFHEGRALRERKAAVDPVVALVAGLPAGFAGDVPVRGSRPLTRAVRRLHVSRWPHLAGPIFSVATGGPFTHPPIDALAEHLKKAYRSAAPIELLSFYYWHPVVPERWSHPTLQAFIATELPRSAFRRVWVYDLASDSILFVYPRDGGRR